MPSASRISFDFLHHIRPPPGATSAPKESFDQLVRFLTSWACGYGNVDDGHGIGGNATVHHVSIEGDNDGSGNGRNTQNFDGKTNKGSYSAGKEVVLLSRTRREKLTLNLLRNLCHVFYFDCSQVKNTLHPETAVRSVEQKAGNTFLDP